MALQDPLSGSRHRGRIKRSLLAAWEMTLMLLRFFRPRILGVHAACIQRFSASEPETRRTNPVSPSDATMIRAVGPQKLKNLHSWWKN